MSSIKEQFIQPVSPMSPEEIKQLADIADRENNVNLRIAKPEFLTLRLHVLYRFIQEQLKCHSKKINRQLEHLDIGVWTGVYQEYLVLLEEISVIYGIDINERRLGQTASREELIPHIINGKLRLFKQDGTNMKNLEGKKFDSISAIEVVVGMKKGQEVPLIGQIGEHLSDDGIAFITFDDEDSNISGGPTWSKGGAVYRQTYMSDVIQEQTGYTAKVEWYGQLLREKTSDGRAIMPFNKEGGMYEILSQNLRVFEIPLGESNIPLVKPMSWIGVIRKNSLQ